MNSEDNKNSLDTTNENDVKNDVNIDENPISEEKSIEQKEEKNLDRVIVTLMNTPGVPPLKTKNRAVDITMTFGELTRKVHKILKLEKEQTLFLYVNNAFSPTLDTTLENVINCFAPGESKLTIHYSINHAFG
ncbi:Ubiquitin-like protein ATG12 [Strongyloides ratti]|uniref:Ubiquitin-like protein ATG12 n=1 Tax=Strongyloides ratti TaxID=34506 RepID=A0A090LCK6_STRRB|nr:Ubiquitin-like protein ATG12 [Strongyloides ratti]CEF65210.1 Ubiquitin-like protein ATG12 [Strongyloides ratti]